MNMHKNAQRWFIQDLIWTLTINRSLSNGWNAIVFFLLFCSVIVLYIRQRLCLMLSFLKRDFVHWFRSQDKLIVINICYHCYWTSPSISSAQTSLNVNTTNINTNIINQLNDQRWHAFNNNNKNNKKVYACLYLFEILECWPFDWFENKTDKERVSKDRKKIE